jgi:hypothetical protein
MQIGKYRVVARLGEGARPARSSSAHDPFHDRDVAIKRVRVGALADPREAHFSERFFAAEAALVGRLHHPNVVQIYDAVADVESPYLVMEYVAGVTLRRFCRADNLLPLEQIVEIGFKCAMALGYCLPPGADPPRREAGQPAGHWIDGDQVVDVKVTDFGSVFNQGADHHAGLPRGRWPTCHPSSSTATPWTAAPTSIRWLRCCTT